MASRNYRGKGKRKAAPRRSAPKYTAPVIRPEKKGVDKFPTDESIVHTLTTNGSSVVVNTTREGSGSFERVGRKITMTSLRIRGYIISMHKLTVTALNYEPNIVRMVVVLDKTPGGNSQPAFDDIFGHTDPTGTEGVRLLAPVSYDSMQRFRILRDKCYHFNPQAQATTSGSSNEVDMVQCVDEYIKLNNMQTTYNNSNTSPGVTDIETGAIYVYFRSILNDAAIARATFTNFSTRLRYYG